jgi:hypothetical protein
MAEIWQRSDIWSQASYRYPISWEAFLDPSDSYFLFADLVGFIHIEHICLFFVAFFSTTIDGRHRFESRSVQTKDNKIGICYFSAKHAVLRRQNKMNCELMLTYDTPALWQTGSRNLTGQKTLPTIWGYLYEACDQISDFCHQ